MAGVNFCNASKAQHLEAVAHAYAAYIQIAGSPTHQATMAELAAAAGQKRSRSTHDLHLIVPQFTSYGGETAVERPAARKLVSRDVRAIQHLKAQRVLPSRVQALGATPGEGLHAWFRQVAVAGPKKIDGKANHETASERSQRSMVHKVIVTTRRADRSRKSRARFTITGVLGQDITVPLRQVKKLASSTSVIPHPLQESRSQYSSRCCLFVLAGCLRIGGTRTMRRMLLRTSLIVLCHEKPAIADPKTETEIREQSTLQKQWHRCVRNAFSGQPMTMSKTAAQRAALRECKAAEDAYLAALLSAQARKTNVRSDEGPGLTSRARAWAASAVSFVARPISSWLRDLVR